MKFINKWLVGKSILCEGTPIPYYFQTSVLENLDEELDIGKSKTILIRIDDRKFLLKLQNQQFNRKKYKDHVPIVRIMYGKCDFSDYLKEKFKVTWSWLELNKFDGERYPRVNEIPQNIKEYFVLYSTNRKNEFEGECITANDISVYQKEFVDTQEEEMVELHLNYSHIDYTAKIIEQTITSKVRKLDRNLIHNLKKIYDFKCQICKINFIESYNVHIAEAHHILPFVTSYNNNSDNLLILCPNHHRIIHKANPKFYRNKLLFKYPNGYEDKLLLNKHL